MDLRIDGDVVAFRHILYCLAEDHGYILSPDPAAERTIERVRLQFFDGLYFERRDGTLERSLDTIVGKTETSLDRQSFLERVEHQFADALREYFETELVVTRGFRYGPNYQTERPQTSCTEGRNAKPLVDPVARPT